MNTLIPCIRCGKPIPWAAVVAGTGPTCSDCLKDPALRVDGPEHGPAPRSGARNMAWPIAKSLTRSMVLPIPGAITPAPGEMICRLVPGTLVFRELSPDLRGYLGGSPDELLHQSLLQHVHQDDRALAEEEFRQVCEHGERNDIVLRLKSSSESWHYLRIYSQARYDASGTLDHLRCNLRDVTDRVRAEQELSRRTEKLIQANEQLRTINRQLKESQARLVQAEKLAAVGTVAAGMAHEINNPLSFVINNTRILGREFEGLFRLVELQGELISPDPARQAELAQEIRHLEDQLDLPYLRDSMPRMVEATYRGLLRVAQIVEKLREFTRLDRGEFGEVDVNESIDQCLLMLGEPLSRLNIRVDRRYVPLPVIRGEVASLNQAFLNLLSNAIDAIDGSRSASGHLEVETQTEGNEIVVEFRDNGEGITPEVLPQIFVPFFTTKPPGRGAGLGLATSRSVVSKHGGSIEVDSTPGEGTCFRVRLPASPAR
jgi:PAS domain S-box-containing protein